MDLETLKCIIIYPFFYGDILYDSGSLGQNKTCSEKCREKDCRYLLDRDTTKATYRCKNGYDNILIVLKDFKFVINGLIYTTNRDIPSGRKDVRKPWIVNEESVMVHIGNISRIDERMSKCIDSTTIQNFSMFHDFKTSMSIIFSCTHELIGKLPGETFTEKIEKSDDIYRDLYNALELITSQLSMIDVIINPSRISFGNKKPMNIYKLFDKIKILFGHISETKKDISIFLEAEGRIKDSMCYESIEFIPLILIDNALKYSVSGTDVHIKFEQGHGKITVIARSVGPYVNKENKERIFEKFFRDKSAEAFSKDGIGVGLWVAQQILKAHESRLYYYNDCKDETKKMGLNVFQFDISHL